MAYEDFTLSVLQTQFRLKLQVAPLFPDACALPVSAWLAETLGKMGPLALVSEKARSEFLVAPILVTVRDLGGGRVALYSGQRMDGAAEVGLTGECDFLLTRTPPLPIVNAPIFGLVEAKKNDVESGLGQCAAQMLGALRFNERSAQADIDTVYGCVTTGEAWQFLRLHGDTLTIDERRYFLNELGLILGVFQSILSYYLPPLTP